MVLRDQLSSLPIITGFAVMIKLMKRWWLKQKETEQLFQEKTKAELQLLKAQVHPHFLFNTLNNIYYFTLSGSPKAPEMINKLSGLLHYILNECNQPLVALQKELNMVRDYMALEKIRYGEQMNMTIEIQEDGFPSLRGDAGRGLIAPLLLIPFVENSFKHGTSKMLAHPWVKLQIIIENNTLHFSVTNSRPQEAEPQVKKGNIGLKNVKKRLELLYPGTHELNIISEPESFFVFLKVQLQEANDYATTNEEIKTATDYAMA
jgi:LytS/YehU family sensor histidine kinase